MSSSSGAWGATTCRPCICCLKSRWGRRWSRRWAWRACGWGPGRRAGWCRCRAGGVPSAAIPRRRGARGARSAALGLPEVLVAAGGEGGLERDEVGGVQAAVTVHVGARVAGGEGVLERDKVGAVERAAGVEVGGAPAGELAAHARAGRGV